MFLIELFIGAFIGGLGLTLGGGIGWSLGEYLISKIINKK